MADSHASNTIVARILFDIAEMLEMKGEVVFRVRAFQKAAKAVENASEAIDELALQGRLHEIPGVGKGIGQVIQELVTTGRIQYFEDLRAEFPDDVRALMEVPGIGPRIATRLYKELDVENITQLEEAARAGRIAVLPRFGAKMQENILRHLQNRRGRDRRTPLGRALPVVEAIIEQLGKHPALANLTPAGSLRRRAETVKDIDLIGTSTEPLAVMEAFCTLPGVREVLVRGPQKASVLVWDGLQVDLRLVEQREFGSLLQHFTGSKTHNILLREYAQRLGLSVSEHGILDERTGEVVAYEREEDVYERLGLQFVPPELREGGEEVQLARARRIPTLVTMENVRGDLHAHSNWSDGQFSIEEMTRAAMARGYSYLAITDHSVSLAVANGLGPERLAKQREEIDIVNGRLAGFRVLAGIEMDIHADGSLDLPDEVLERLDVVVASVHMATRQSAEDMTRRLIHAIENPHVDIIGHPTSRLLGSREASDLDMEAVFAAAARTGTMLEINGGPDRLDLKDVHARRAKDLGVLLVTNSDAHTPHQLEQMRYSISVARRAWLEPEHVANTWPLEALLSRLSRG